MKIRVYYEDTDSGGVVYHTNYIKYCERARSEMFFTHNIPLEIDGVVFVVKNLEANYIKAAKLGDILDVKTTTLELKQSYIKLQQQIFKDDILIFEAKIKLVSVLDGKIKRIDKNILLSIGDMISNQNIGDCI
jgi:acyl-CoA thioester hydrolase